HCARYPLSLHDALPIYNPPARLPQEIGEHLYRTETMGGLGTGERFDRDEFINRVSQRSGADRPQAVYQARVVFELLDEATTGERSEEHTSELQSRENLV